MNLGVRRYSSDRSGVHVGEHQRGSERPGGEVSGWRCCCVGAEKGGAVSGLGFTIREIPGGRGKQGAARGLSEVTFSPSQQI